MTTGESGRHRSEQFLADAELPASSCLRAGSAHATAAMGGSLAPFRDGPLLCAVVGRPRWEGDGLARLAAERGPGAALAAAVRASPDAWPRLLGGHFAAAVLDTEAGTAELANDRIGVRGLYYGVSGGGDLVFGTRVAPLLAFPGIDGGLSEQGLYQYVYFHMVPSPGTIYRGLRKLEPAQRIRCVNGVLEHETYWRPQFIETTEAPLPDLNRRLHGLLDASVGAAAEDAPRLGAYLSGGLDSSTVSGKLRDAQGSAHTFSIGFDAEGYDETPYARATAAHFGTEQHEYFVTPEDVVSGVQSIAAAYDEPFGNSSALPAYFCARLAREQGVDVLLGGDGGDEIFAGNERYRTQEVFERYLRVPPPVRGLLEVPFRVMPGLRRAPLLRKADSYIRQAKTPLPDRLQSYNFLHRMRPEEVFSPDLLAQVDPAQPLALQRRRYHEPQDASRVNRMLYLDWKFTLADNDLPKVTRTAELAGVEVRYPMLSDALVDFACQVPTGLKLKGDRLRWFYRQAMEGYLPERVLTKSKHGFGLPFGVWMRTHAPLRDLASASLERLRSTGLFRGEFLERALEQHRSGHAAYYGELVWILMMLDLWLTTHAGTRPGLAP